MGQPHDEILNPEVGRRIAEVREERGLTQRQLAEKAGISVAFLSEIENGKRNLSSGKLLRIADELSVSTDYLLRGEHTTIEEQPIAVPPELHRAAKAQGWSYPEAAALLEAQRLIKARRGPDGEDAARPYTQQDWIRLYRKVFE
jgi:transcriptional regulator with XRE-family HTH domain